MSIRSCYTWKKGWEMSTEEPARTSSNSTLCPTSTKRWTQTTLQYGKRKSLLKFGTCFAYCSNNTIMKKNHGASQNVIEQYMLPHKYKKVITNNITIKHCDCPYRNHNLNTVTLLGFYISMQILLVREGFFSSIKPF